QIETDLADGETYVEIANADRTGVRDALDRIATLLADAPSLDALDAAARDEAIAQQDVVNTLLDRAAEDSRRVCERRDTIGSNRRAVVCETVAARKRRSERDQEGIRQIRDERTAVPQPE